MSGFSFSKKRDIERVLQMANAPTHATALPQHTTIPIDYNTAGYVYLTPDGGIPARIGSLCGTAQCTPYFIDRLTNELKELLKGNGESQTHLVHNIETDPVPPNTHINALRIFDRVVALKSAAGEMIAFDTGGYCDAAAQPQVFYVLIDREGSDLAPSESPADHSDFPPNTKLIYEGWSWDINTGGETYNSHLWLYMVCDSSFFLPAWIDSNAILDWVGQLPENVGAPNDSWLLSDDSPGIPIDNKRDTLLALIDDKLQQQMHVPYSQEDLVPLPPNDYAADLDCDTFLCSERNPAWNVVGRELRVRVTERSCGTTKAHEEDADGYVVVRDTLGSFLYGRSPAELNCRRGVAAWMHTPGEYECHWLIVWMDMFDEIQVVSDVIIGTLGIEIERKRIDVWRECDLPVEYIEGNTCEES